MYLYNEKSITTKHVFNSGIEKKYCSNYQLSVDGDIEQSLKVGIITTFTSKSRIGFSINDLLGLGYISVFYDNKQMLNIGFGAINDNGVLETSEFLDIKIGSAAILEALLVGIVIYTGVNTSISPSGNYGGVPA